MVFMSPCKPQVSGGNGAGAEAGSTAIRESLESAFNSMRNSSRGWQAQASKGLPVGLALRLQGALALANVPGATLSCWPSLKRTASGALPALKAR